MNLALARRIPQTFPKDALNHGSKADVFTIDFAAFEICFYQFLDVNLPRRIARFVSFHILQGIKNKVVMNCYD